MSRGKKCLPTVSRQFFNRNYPRQNCLLNTSQTGSRPQDRAFFLFQSYPRGEGNCDTVERQKLSRGNFCPATSRCLFWPTGWNRTQNRTRTPSETWLAHTKVHANEVQMWFSNFRGKPAMFQIGWAPQAPEARGDEILRFQPQEP